MPRSIPWLRQPLYTQAVAQQPYQSNQQPQGIAKKLEHGSFSDQGVQGMVGPGTLLKNQTNPEKSGPQRAAAGTTIRKSRKVTPRGRGPPWRRAYPARCFGRSATWQPLPINKASPITSCCAASLARGTRTRSWHCFVNMPVLSGGGRRLLRHEQDAEDAFQATFLVLARKAASIRQTDALSSWLYGVANHIASNLSRSACRLRLREQRPRVSTPEAPVATAALHELQTMLDIEIGRLPEKYRAPFELCCLEGKSKPQTAQLLGWCEGTVASRLARARQLLQERLARRGVMLSAVLCASSLWEQSAAAAIPRGLV